ncbi:MAG TPA: cytochrome ubiquinol oxidase subunit I [Thermoleophilaceae bacterium]|nr:cytochrome ubiquinol oxidase subunit I [Thermoleophilaceae bacterium]
MIDLGLLAQVAPPSGGLGDPGPQPDLLDARQMQAMSFMFHIPLVCFGISFPAMVLFLEGLWLRTGDPVYKRLAKRWSKVMLIMFAVGVVTGTVLSFEFGLLWPNFTATFGEVFGLGFALEGFSFFIEAIFIAIYVYGWDRIRPRLHFLCGIPVVITGITGSLMVIGVNGWMNNPTGFDVHGGKVTNVRPWEALFNDYLAHELVHMYVAGYLVAGFIVAGVYARAWLKGRRDRYHRVGLVVSLTIACLAAPVQLVVGDWAARTVADRQPVKLAAFEGLANTEKGAEFTIGGIYEDGALEYGISIPKLLSVLADHDPNGVVKGLNTVPKEDQPPVNPVHLSFQVMVFIGTGLAALAALYLLTWWRKRRLPQSKWFYRGVVAAGPLALVALIAGWVTTEVGRQPWVVYDVMRTSQAVTAADGLEIGYVFLAVLYASLAVAVFWLLRRLSRQPAEAD